jgi:hypothetical protein
MISLGETDITESEIISELQSRNIAKQTNGEVAQGSIFENKWFWAGVIAIGLMFFTSE